MATEVIMPRQGQSVESCILVEWLVKEGDQVTEGQPLASIETDKAVFEIESPAAGELRGQFFEAGDDIPVLTVIGAIGEAGEDVSSMRPAGDSAASDPTEPVEEPAAVVEQPAAPAVAESTGAEAPTGDASRGVSPRAKKLAQAKGVDASGVSGTGPGGRVIERDVAAVAAQMPRMSGAAKEAMQAGAAVPGAGSGPGGMVLSKDLGKATASAGAKAPVAEPVTVPLKGIRKLIAGKMHESLATTAQITLNMRFDATGLLAYRAKVKANAEALGLPNITINDLIAYTVIRTLLKYPAMNAHFLADRSIEYPYVNLGIATDTERGLMVPVINQADQLSLRELSDAIKPLIKACQSGSVSPDLLSGGTFTITNMGMLGVDSFTPVLNIPEVAILGVGALSLMPVMRDGDVMHVQSINLSLTVDHQVIDGAPAARFLKDLCTGLEHIELTLAG